MEYFHKHSDLLDNIKGRVKDGEYKMLMESLAEIKNIKRQTKFIRVKRIYMVSKVYWGDVEGEEGICVSDSRAHQPWDAKLSFSHDSKDTDDPHLTSLCMRAEMKDDETILQVIPETDHNIKNSISERHYEQMKEEKISKFGDVTYIYIEDIE